MLLIMYKTIYTEPVVGTTQLFGDDYFLQLCVKYLDVPLERDNGKYNSYFL